MVMRPSAITDGIVLRRIGRVREGAKRVGCLATRQKPTAAITEEIPERCHIKYRGLLGWYPPEWMNAGVSGPGEVRRRTDGIIQAIRTTTIRTEGELNLLLGS